MDLMDFIKLFLSSISITSLLAIYLKKSIEHKFDEKLELLKADLISKGAEIAALRDSAMTAMASRHMEMDKRRIDAVDQLWSAVIALTPVKNISAYMAVIKFETAAEEAEKNSKLREMFTAISAGFDPNKIDLSGSTKARPFISPMACALFSAYEAIVMQSVAKMYIIKFGLGANTLNKDSVVKLVKIALPHQEVFINKVGDSGYHYLLDELEGRILDELRKMLTGVETDKASLEQAAEIVKLSNVIMNDCKFKNSEGTIYPNAG